METFKIKTWGCVCGYHQDFKPVIPFLVCPSCGSHTLKKETDPDKLCTVTIAGDDSIDNEIKREPDLNTKTKKDKYRAERSKEIKESMKKMRLLEEKIV